MPKSFCSRISPAAKNELRFLYQQPQLGVPGRTYGFVAVFAIGSENPALQFTYRFHPQRSGCQELRVFVHHRWGMLIDVDTHNDCFIDDIQIPLCGAVVTDHTVVIIAQPARLVRKRLGEFFPLCYRAVFPQFRE